MTRYARVFAALTLLVAACSGAPAGSPAPATGGPSPSTASLSPAPRSTPSPTPTQLTVVPLPGEAWVVYRWPLTGDTDGIWLSRPDGADQHELLPSLPGGQASPAWSPDGEQIVFGERTPSETIWIVNADGSDPHEIVPGTSGCCGQDHPYWSPDGRLIAFMRWIGPETALTSQVMVYDLTDGSLKVAATAKAPMTIDHPRWSPDGKRFAVEVGHLDAAGVDYDGAAIGLIDVETGDLEVLTALDQFGAYPNWRADGKALVFDTYGYSYFRDSPAGKATNLWSIDVDGSGLLQLTHNAAGGQRATQPYWRADGTIAYIDAGPRWGQGLTLRYLTADGDPMPDPAIPIRGAYPRFRPGS